MNLIEAANQGDDSILAAAIAKSKEVDSRNKQGWTALMVAMVSKFATVSMVKMLLKNGANPNALTSPPAPIALPDCVDYTSIMEKLGEEIGVKIPTEIPQESPKSVLAVSILEAGIDKIDLLLSAGADASFVDEDGYSVLVKASYGASSRTMEENQAIFEMLLAKGAQETPPTKHGESVVSVLSGRGDFELLKFVLERGFDYEKLEWTPLFHAIAFEDYSAVQRALLTTENLEHRDAWDRTPFLLAVVAGRLDVVQLLASNGCMTDAIGRCGATALEYSIEANSVDVCRWLIENGSDIEATNQFDKDPLRTAVDVDSVGCAKLLVEAGADVFQVCEYGFGLLHDVESVEMFEFLAGQGLNTNEASQELRLQLLGGTSLFTVSEQEYLKNRERRFGTCNPEQMNNAFWDAQVKTRYSAYQADEKFGRSAFDSSSPTWCCDRNGQSLTPLPDGRIVEIGGEHEDGYDPDFCIYNDVIVHDGDGRFEIYGYPESVFPPTDFHSATLVGDKIVIIGRLGYPQQRQPVSTPVFVLNCEDYSIENFETTGPAPNWLYKHTALLLDSSRILVQGGKSDHEDNKQPWILDLQEKIWIRK